MSLYDAAKDAVKLAQKIDNIELIQKLLDVQQQALDMQEKQQEQGTEIASLKQSIAKLKESKKFVFTHGNRYLIDPDFPNIHLCPVHTRKYGFAAPLARNGVCMECKVNYE